MSKVMVSCDGCKKIVVGLRFEGGTSGFYKGSIWEKFMDNGEKILCDTCMFKKPEYQKEYGVNNVK